MASKFFSQLGCEALWRDCKWIFKTAECFPTFADISIAVVDLLQEMTDVDTLTENEEGADIMLDALVIYPWPSSQMVQRPFWSVRPK